MVSLPFKRDYTTIQRKRKAWSNINISIENFKFKIEFDYEDLKNSEFDSYERHVIWRYDHLKEDSEVLSRKDRKIKKRINFIRVKK